ncbi:hypothetical protein V1478_001612 [Vespula squamosa]|uniref:Uncharacterized protein n=1 Tax=Vespula squamosa TaxID=30214 RepID=A0ABD2C1Z2_VESSQ
MKVQSRTYTSPNYKSRCLLMCYTLMDYKIPTSLINILKIDRFLTTMNESSIQNSLKCPKLPYFLCANIVECISLHLKWIRKSKFGNEIFFRKNVENSIYANNESKRY